MISQSEWRQVYMPNDMALTIRLNATFDRLAERPEKCFVWKPRRILVAALIAMALFATIAIAAGLFSRDAAVKNAAWQRLKTAYGLNDEMQSFFAASVAWDGNDSAATFTPAAGNAINGRLGTYTVRLHGGQADASWSLDGAANDGTLTSGVWDARQLAQGIALRKAGQEWHEIVGGGEGTPQITASQAKEIASAALIAQYGAEAVKDYEVDVHLCTTDIEGGYRQFWNIGYQRDGSIAMAANVSAEDGAVLEITGAPTNARAAGEAQSALVSRAGIAVRERFGLSEKALSLFKPWVAEEEGAVEVIFIPEILDAFSHALDSCYLKGGTTNTLFSDLMGSYTVRLTGDAADSVIWSLSGVAIDPHAAWGAQSAYDAAALDKLYALLAAYDGITAQYVQDEHWNGLSLSIPDAAARDALLRDAGFDAAVYNAVTPEAGMVSEKEITAAAALHLQERYSLARDDINAATADGRLFCTCQRVGEQTLYTVWLHTSEGIYTVTADAATGLIESVLFDNAAAIDG